MGLGRLRGVQKTPTRSLNDFQTRGAESENFIFLVIFVIWDPVWHLMKFGKALGPF